MAKTDGKVTKLEPLIDAVKKVGARTPEGFKTILKAQPDKWIELIKTGKSLKEYLGIDRNGEPNVFILDVPWAGGGVEASVFFGVANIDAMWDFTD